MKKLILSVILAVCSVYCTIFSVSKFFETTDDVFAILAVLFGFCIIASIGMALEDTKLPELIVSKLFGKEEDDD